MMSYKRVIFSLMACVTTMLTLAMVGCTTEVDYTLGEEFIPSKQNMELKRRVYRLGEWREDGNTAECQLLETRLYQTDSVASANVEKGYFGAERSDIYGERRAGFMTQMIFSMNLNDDRGWGYRPIFDSMALSLYVADFHGDTTIKRKFEVYEITSNDYFDVGVNREGEKDTTFYINFDPKPYISAEPIFTFEYPNQEKGIYVGDLENQVNRGIKLDETPATRDYVKRLMLTTDLDATDGYAYDVDGIYVAGNERKFLDVVRGVYIVPSEDEIEGEGAMFAADLENTALVLYSRDRYEEDPSIIRDTTYMVYNFFLNPMDYDIEAGNVSINTVRHDFSSAAFTAADIDATSSERPEVLIGYVDGMGGVVTEITFTDEFIQSLADIALSEEDAAISVNQARLTIYLEGSDYEQMFDPLSMATVMDGAMARAGLYANYKMFVGIPDYAYSLESTYALDYGGYLNRSLAAYTMDISAQIQSLMMAAQDNVDEEGKVKLEKFTEGYEPAGESLVAYRRIYLGPDATARFGFNRQAVYGTDGEVDGKKNPTPITLDLTYTIVR